MARPNAPWWWAARQCWACNLNGRRIRAPRTIKEQDRHAAWAWHERVVAVKTPTPQPGPHTFAAIGNAYLQDRAARVGEPAASSRNFRSLTSHVKQLCATQLHGRLLGNTIVGRLTPEHYTALQTQWKKVGFSANTCYCLAGVLRRVLNWASRPAEGRGRLLPANPFAGLPHPKPGVPPDRFAGRPQAAIWLRWLRSSGAPRFYIASQRALIHTGARPSELLAATWRNVTMDAGTLPGGQRYGTITLANWKNSDKTGKARRIVLTPRLLRLIRRLRAEAAGPDAPIFSPDGRPLTSHVLSECTRRARMRAEAAGVPLPFTGPDRVTNYLWRHVAISTVIMRGVDLATAATLFGTSPAMIMRTYAHLFTDHLATAAAHLQRGRIIEKPRRPGNSPSGSSGGTS